MYIEKGETTSLLLHHYHEGQNVVWPKGGSGENEVLLSK